MEQTYTYMLLSRLQSDCEYFLNWGHRSINNLYYKDVNKHIEEMKNLWNSLLIKPEWLSYEEIENYQKEMEIS